MGDRLINYGQKLMVMCNNRLSPDDAICNGMLAISSPASSVCRTTQPAATQ